MGKANEMGSSWASGLKFKQWLRWIGGDGAVPDTRSRKIMAGTASLVVVLLALGWFVVGGGGAQPSGKHNPSSAASTSGSLFPTSQGANAPASGFTPVTTSTTTSTLPPAKATTVSKRTHQHTRHTGARRTRPRNSSKHA
jgi:hypothetical protein